ncbi:MAG TPA: DUF4388 domain-containing protein [Planctomycetota bacterium]|nr:DUF4388 domain-containing protein [Planctomycetota bacterium]
MRTFGGDLGILGLGNLLQVISMSQAKGLLTISNGDLKKTMQFTSQGIRLVSGVRRAIPLGQILVRSGRLTNEQLESLLAEQRQSNRRLGDLVIETGMVSKEGVEGALRDQVAEEIYELFAWPEARFYFAESDNEALPAGSGPLATVLLDSNVISIMVEAARRADEMALIRSEIPMDQLVPRRTGPPVPLNEQPAAVREVLTLVDGHRSIEHITHESSYPKFTVLHTLYDLKQRGVLAMDADASAVTTLKRPTGPSVLVICKDAAARGETAGQLSTAGYNAIEADSWSAAESWLDAIKAVIVDVSFDAEDGFSICDQLRDASRKPFIVVADTAAGNSFDQALQSGARYVLLKPVAEQQLLDRLKSLL